jgi:hypothetical protein
LGVDRLDALGVLLKARVTTRPRDQWAVGREYNRRLKLAFEQEGIDFTYRPPGPPAATVATAKLDGDDASAQHLSTRRSFAPEAHPRS